MLRIEDQEGWKYVRDAMELYANAFPVNLAPIAKAFWEKHLKEVNMTLDSMKILEELHKDAACANDSGHRIEKYYWDPYMDARTLVAELNTCTISLGLASGKVVIHPNIDVSRKIRVSEVHHAVWGLYAGTPSSVRRFFRDVAFTCDSLISGKKKSRNTVKFDWEDEEE